jgi:dTDP-4-amino-4,6-dideoxygalactose transaminase
MDTFEKLKLLRDHGRAENGDVEFWGYNSRLDNIQAGFLNYYFQTYEETISRRREIADIYFENLKDISQLTLPPSTSDLNHFDVFQNYEIQAEDRDNLKNYLQENDVGTLIQWGGKAVHQFKKLGFTENLPFTEDLFTKLLMIPINMTITDEEVNFVSNKIQEFYS